MKFETALAQSSMDRVAMRNPDNTYHPMTMTDLPELTPDFAWKAVHRGFENAGLQRSTSPSPIS